MVQKKNSDEKKAFNTRLCVARVVRNMYTFFHVTFIEALHNVE